MISIVGGIKGGSGKTTVATNLCIMRAWAGRDVLLIDADDQETASDFTTLRNERTDGKAGYTSIKLTGPAVRTQTQRLADKYQDVIIDTGGRDTASQRAASTRSAMSPKFRAFASTIRDTVAARCCTLREPPPSRSRPCLVTRS